MIEKAKIVIKKYSKVFWQGLKIIGTLAFFLLTGRFFYSFFNSKKTVSVQLLNLRKVLWKKHGNDSPDIMGNPLSDKEIDNELEKLDL